MPTETCVNGQFQQLLTDAKTVLEINDDGGLDRTNFLLDSVLLINNTVGNIITISTNRN